MPRLDAGARLGYLVLASAALLGACGEDRPTTDGPSGLAGPPSLAISVSSSNFQQCANGGDGGETCFYINGVLNDSKSLYHESDVIAQRFVIPGLTVGHTYRLAFDYGWEKAVNPGHMNYDFVAGWNTTLGALANPCGDPLGNPSADIRAVCGTDHTVKTTHTGANAGFQAIPDGIFTANAPLGLAAELQAAIDRFQSNRGADALRFDILGGSFPDAAFDNVTYVVSGDNVTARITLRFTAKQTTAMLLWGGHFADSRDWRLAVWDDDKNAGTPQDEGNLTGAAGQSGAPFHFTQQYIKNLNTGDSTGIGSLSNNVQGSVLEAVPKASISIAATATNGIGEPHTFTVTLLKDLDDGNGPVAAAGEHVTVTLTPAGGAVVQLDAAASTCDNAGANTDANGKCTITFTSNAPGTVTGSATATLSLGGTSVTVSTDGSVDNSPPAVKTFVTGTLRWLKHDGVGQLLGGAVFTICRTHVFDSDLNAGAGGYTDITDVCLDVTDNISGTDNTNAPPADRDGTAGEFEVGGLILGRYTVKEKTAPTGYSLDPDTETRDLSTTSPSATIAAAFVNPRPAAKISIGAAATNGIGESHTFRVKLEKDLGAGAGFVAAQGEHVDFSLTNGAGAAAVLNAASSTCDDAGANTDASGECTIVFTSSSAGTVTGSASATLTVGGVQFTVQTNGANGSSTTVVKTFVAGSLRWLKKDGAGALLGGAVFTVCRTHLWDSDLNAGSGGYTDIDPDVCFDVTDNVSGADNTSAPPADRDGTAGEFQLGGLILGKYTVKEKTAPNGYVLDPDTENAELSTTSPSATIQTAFVNIAPDAFITIGPATATNDVGESHMFTAKMTVIPNGGTPVSIESFAITVSPPPSTLGTIQCAAFDAAENSMTCTLTINSNVAGTFTANASATGKVGSISLPRDTDPATAAIGAGPGGSGPAEKKYEAPLLSIDKTPDLATDEGGEVHPGEQAAFTITVRNSNALGTGTANGVSMTDTLPAGLDWNENDAKCEITSVNVEEDDVLVPHDVITCDIGTLAKGASFSVTVTATVPAGIIVVPPSPAGDAVEIDGDLADGAAAGKDWESLASSVFSCSSPVKGCKIDQPTGQTDNSFGQGAKEDTPVPSVVAGSIPNNKSDLRRLYVATERFGTTDYLYLAWSRVQEPNGTTNMDFELNQSSQLTANGVTPVRTAGDVLVRYDLSKGGTQPALGFHKWITSGSSSLCESANSTPCWDKKKLLTNDVKAAINTVQIPEPIAGGTLSARTFGEASINLQLSGIFDQNVCRNFGSAYLKSRSSDAFTSELKDFIAPIPVTVTNCKPVTLNNKAWAEADNFKPAGGNLGGSIFDTGKIEVTEENGTASLNLAPTGVRLASAYGVVSSSTGGVGTGEVLAERALLGSRRRDGRTSSR